MITAVIFADLLSVLLLQLSKVKKIIEYKANTKYKLE